MKPLGDFYCHPQMADGHLNKCKTCTKADVRAARRRRLSHYREYDRRRAMTPHRVKAREAYRSSPRGREVVRQINARYRKRKRG